MEKRFTLRSIVLVFALVAVSAIALADWTQGISAFNSGNFEEAATHFTEITRSNPDWPGGYYMLGRSQSEMGLEKEAIQNLQQAYDLDSSDSDTVIALSQALMVENRFTETRELLEGDKTDAMSAPLRSQATILLASAMLGEGETGAAVVLLQERLAVDSDNSALNRLLGKAWAENGDLEGAYRSYARAFAVDSEESSGMAAITTALELKGEATSTDQQIRWSRKALEIGKQLANTFPNAEYDLMAGEAALGAEDFEAAEGWFRAALSKDESDPQAWYFLGRTLVALGQESDGYEAFSTALTAEPNGGLARRINGRMGQIAACRLDLELASTHYRSAMREDKAEQLDQLVVQFAEAQAQREKLSGNVREIQQMERELAELGDAQGVSAMRERAAAELTKIAEIEQNLQAVRSALCR